MPSHHKPISFSFAANGATVTIIDGYTHCGLNKYEPIDQVRRAMTAAGVSGAILVQHLGEYDNSYIGEVAGKDPEHLAAVCTVDHEAPDAVDALKRCGEAEWRFRGVRLLAEVVNVAPQLLYTAADLGMIIVLFAPEGMGDYLEPVATFLEGRPKCQLVLSHLAIPLKSGGPDLPASRAAFELAKYPSVYYQVSGMKMHTPYPHEPIYPLITEALNHFGPSRLYWGSNYPVVGNEQDYVNDLRLLLDGMLPVPEAAVANIAGLNAQRLWFA